MKEQQAKLFLEQLQTQYPHAFKRNFLFYSMLKTKGLFDELKELIPWLLAAMIFVSISIVLSSQITMFLPEIGDFRAHGLAVLAIMLFFMLICPLVIKQIKHSSGSLYLLHRHTPIKLAVLIILQALNVAFIEYYFLLSLLFFFAISFGFVKFYKENLFRSETELKDYYYLDETRRICFWSYKQIIKNKLLLAITGHNEKRQNYLSQKIKILQELHVNALNFEHQLCKKMKYLDLDEYLDEISK